VFICTPIFDGRSAHVVYFAEGQTTAHAFGHIAMIESVRPEPGMEAGAIS
jgi:hypothetical protein